MKDGRGALGPIRASIAGLVSLALVLAPWPAWGQSARLLASAGVERRAVPTAAGAPVVLSFGDLSDPGLDAPKAALPSVSIESPEPLAVAPVSGTPAAAAVSDMPAAGRERVLSSAASVRVRGQDEGVSPAAHFHPSAMAEAARLARALAPRAAYESDVPDSRVGGTGAPVLAESAASDKNAVAARRKADDSLAAVVDRDAPAPAPPAAPKLFSKVVLGFLSTFLMVSTVVESTSLAVSQMTQPLSHGFMGLSTLEGVGFTAYAVGSFIGGRWIKKFGIRYSYPAVLALRALIWSALALLLNPATGTIALWALIPLFSLDYFFHSIGRVTEHALQVTLFNQSKATSSRFGSLLDFIEYGSSFIGSASIAVLAVKFGFAAVIYPAAPIFALAALVAAALRLPSAAPGELGGWSDGFKTVLRLPGIFKPMSGVILVNSFVYMMLIIATAFGAYIAPDPAHALATAAGSVMAFFAMGALAGATVMYRVAARIGQKLLEMPAAARKAAETRLYMNSASKVMPWAAAALLGSWLFIDGHQIGALIWPVFPVSLALVAIGLTAQMASNHLDVIMKSNIPRGKQDMAVGAIGAMTYATYAVGLIIWGTLFGLFGVYAFPIFAGCYTVAAGAYLWIARSLKRGKA